METDLQKRDLDLKKRDEDVIRLKQQKNKLLKEISTLKEANEKLSQEMEKNASKAQALMLDDLIPTRENAIVSLQTGPDFDEMSVASQNHSMMMTERQGLAASAQRRRSQGGSQSKFQRSPSASKHGQADKQNMQASQLAKPSPRRPDKDLAPVASIAVQADIA